MVVDFSGGEVSALYVTPFLDENLSLTTRGSTYYYTQDGLGSVRTVTDASGNLVCKYDYDPFGAPYAGNASTENFDNIQTPGTRATLDQRYTYTGREKSLLSGLQYNRYRFYDAKIGRWITRDPVGYKEEIGLYIFVDNNPAKYIDSYGLFPSTPQPIPLPPDEYACCGGKKYDMTKDCCTESEEILPIKKCWKATEKRKKCGFGKRIMGAGIAIGCVAYGIGSNILAPLPDPTDPLWISGAYTGAVMIGGYVGPGILAGVGVKLMLRDDEYDTYVQKGEGEAPSGENISVDWCNKCVSDCSECNETDWL